MRASRQDPERLRRALHAQRERLVEPGGSVASGGPGASGGPDEYGAVGEGPSDVARLRAACVRAVVSGLDRGIEPDRDALRVAVRALLDQLAEIAPGRSVEVRVPPYAAVQCVEGPRHTRGTPSSVVETDAQTWIALATGRLGWVEAVGAGRVQASGLRSDLSGYLPLSTG